MMWRYNAAAIVHLMGPQLPMGSAFPFLTSSAHDGDGDDGEDYYGDGDGGWDHDGEDLDGDGDEDHDGDGDGGDDAL